MSENDFQYIRDYYCVPAYKGVQVNAYGKEGIITGANGCYVMVRLAGEKIARPYHPTDGMTYKTCGSRPLVEKNKTNHEPEDKANRQLDSKMREWCEAQEKEREENWIKRHGPDIPNTSDGVA